MDFSNNQDVFNFNEESVRLPDEARVDRLIDDININQDNFEFILEKSRREYEEQEFERFLQEQSQREQEKQKKQNQFSNTKIQLNKLTIFDRPNLYYYELVLSIIEMYSNGFITEYKVKLTEHNNIFQILKFVRIPVSELEELKKLIISE